MNWRTNTLQTAASGTSLPLVGSGSFFATQEPHLGAVTLSFATGACGSESWAGLAAAAFTSANIGALSTAGLNYVISTGGAGGIFTCATPGAFASFIASYYTPQMVGVDFDIESSQTQAEIQQLVADVAAVQTQYPNLRFSFTLATLAASDGSHAGINLLGQEVVQAIQASSPAITNYTINLMAMDYGKASTASCVIVGSVCAMGQSAVQAVENLEYTYGVPASHIEVTPMIGQNNTSGEITTLGDVDTVTSYAIANGLAGLHYWSLDRDTPCAKKGSVSSSCNSVSGSTPLQYTNEFLLDLGR
ncbi:glycosyl hydrolase [Dyella halodurans]